MKIRHVVAAVAATMLIVLGALLGTPRSSFGDSPPPQPAVGAVLLPAVPAPSGPTARASSSSYVHQANCQQALIGANGDDDVHFSGALKAFDWDGYVRYGNTRFLQWVNLYMGPTLDAPYDHWLLGQPFYCMGDDSAIVDKAFSPPAGW